MTIIKNIPDLYNYLDAIPEERWCVQIRVSRSKKEGNIRCCFLGHIDQYLDLYDETGFNYKRVNGWMETSNFLESIGLSRLDQGYIVDANNKDQQNPKRGTLECLKKLMERYC